VANLRVHVAGSAAPECERQLLETAHAYLRRLSELLIEHGHGLVVTATSEPRGESGMPIIFDWTLLESVAAAPDPAPDWPARGRARFLAVGSGSGLEKRPDEREGVWTVCSARSDFSLVVAPPGWRMAGIIRERQVDVGDVLIVFSGGAGGEHLAQLYRSEGKPVIPLNAQLGASHRDGSGGGAALHARALDRPGDFFALRDGAGSGAARLSALRIDVATDVDALAAATVALIDDLRPPTAFYVRLLDTGAAEYPTVERFFRDVVDHVIIERGFKPREMGRETPNTAFMNAEIFNVLHRAALVVVDLTAMRTNCLMELGYALGRRRRFVISAQDGTHLGFDHDKLPTYFWTAAATDDDRRSAYRDWLDLYSDLPPIVE
jgi:TIR- and PNP-associating SLOG family